ncbi:hypothetical protein BLNAU_23352 [Blattamonas nauphoetae]|uniref:Uncharacterized protein n=1 Tax=Blattamonas nauphoetae TaxID=2049346 RepID=A0ABQ9WQI8_9EUKA|nr:hypothetical protein BLNAU_23352 [Blattamonas nauphoetae]
MKSASKTAKGTRIASKCVEHKERTAKRIATAPTLTTLNEESRRARERGGAPNRAPWNPLEFSRSISPHSFTPTFCAVNDEMQADGWFALKKMLRKTNVSLFGQLKLRVRRKKTDEKKEEGDGGMGGVNAERRE